MRIQNLKQPEATMPVATGPETGGHPAAGGQGATHVASHGPSPGASPMQSGAGNARHALEIALLNARVQHLEMVIETARSLMGSNQERLLRRLHELPREIADLSAQLRQFEPAGLTNGTAP